MRKLASYAVLTALALAGGAFGQGAETSQAQAGGFRVMQFATVDPEQVISLWNRPGADVQVPGATNAARNQPIVTFIVFGGCKADAKGNCNVTADFVITDPTGKVYNRRSGVDVWINRPQPPEPIVELSAGALGLRIEDGEPAGPYRVRAVVTDHVAGVTVTTEQVLSITDGADEAETLPRSAV